MCKPRSRKWQLIDIAAETVYKRNLAQKTELVMQVAFQRGSTPLHQAAMNGHLPLVVWLLQHGAGESLRVRKADVIADGDCTLVQLNGDDFHKLLGHSLQEVAGRNFNRKVLSDAAMLDNVKEKPHPAPRFGKKSANSFSLFKTLVDE